MNLLSLEAYAEQALRWPVAGCHVLAHYDDATIVVYQAYQRAIADWAIAHQQLGGPDFSFSRMTWIKPNFLWMMYRSGWGTKAGQEVVLGLRLQRQFFDRLMATAVPSSFGGSDYESEAAWQRAVKASSVRSQWDPDHLPSGRPTERRAIQLGLRAETVVELAGPALIQVIDMTPIVEAGREHVERGDLHLLMTPLERVYPLPQSA